jgi:subtilisin family serine protease
MADFSSRGPCEDGRIKPDVVAPGTWIASLQSESATDQYAWAGISPNYQFQGGTSQAGPHVSGAAAVFVQYFRATHTNATPSPALVKAALINGAVDMDNTVETGPTPNMDEGWGRVDLTEMIDPERTFDYVDQSAPLTNGQIFERKILLVSGDEPLKVTLTYTDEPGFPGAIPALVNDLDLEVVAPDGHIYRGNQFDNGESVANAPGHDNINNVEGVYVSTPGAGEYILRVRARSVFADARGDTTAVDQDFALVTSAHLAAPGASVVVLDRAAYRAPDTLKIILIDHDLAGQPSATVLVRSTTEILGENYTLNASGSSGTFTGTVATLTGAAIADGKLQIAHNNTIEVRYFDASTGTNQTATARADLVAPVITSVATTNEFGQTLVSWVTDEPANSVVRYNTNSTLTKASTNATLTADHVVALSGLLSNKTYFFHAASTDEAGNTATNSGAPLTFIAPTVSAVLLVDAYYGDLFEVPRVSLLQTS